MAYISASNNVSLSDFIGSKKRSQLHKGLFKVNKFLL